MTLEEFHQKRKPFYIDGDSLLVKFSDTRHANMSHAEWFADYGYPWAHTVRGYYLKTETDSFVMIYWNDFEIPNIVFTIIPYIFEHFLDIKWIGLGCKKGKIGEIWEPKFKVYKN